MSTPIDTIDRMRWSISDIADAVEAGLKQCAADADLEQAVYGIDALDELGLHPLIERALSGGGFGAWREQRYPDFERARRWESRNLAALIRSARRGPAPTPAPEPAQKPTLRTRLLAPVQRLLFDDA